jgi:hypothetical protein
MYQRMITAQQQASGQNPIDLDNPDMFYLLFFKQFDVNTIGGWSSTVLDKRRLPSIVHTDYADFPSTLLNQDKFVAVATAHEIAHKLGQADHVSANDDANAVYLMVSSLSINRAKLSTRYDDKKYPCRLRREDWNKVNYVYPTPR